jgi:hypothetical protein
MFILIRILIALSAFILRFIDLFGRKGRFDQSLDGRPYGVKINYSKRRGRAAQISSIEIDIPLSTDFIFKLTPEKKVDALAKLFGIAQEVQTGDTQFDEAVYVASDQPELHRILRSRPNFRAAVCKLLSAGYDSIVSRGEVLKLRNRFLFEPNPDHLNAAFLIADELQAANYQMRLQERDPFIIRALIVECLVWSIAAYALSSLVDFVVWVRYIEPAQLVMPGILATVAAFCILMLLNILIMKGSSRAHRVLVEAAVVLVFSLPVLGFLGVSDINIGLDASEPVALSMEVQDKEVIERRRRIGYRGSRTRRAYQLTFAPVGNTSGISPPTKIQVTREEYNRAYIGGAVHLSIRRGWLGFPWIEKTEVIGAAPIAASSNGSCRN